MGDLGRPRLREDRDDGQDVQKQWVGRHRRPSAPVSMQACRNVQNSGLGDVDVPAHLFSCRHAEMRQQAVRTWRGRGALAQRELWRNCSEAGGGFLHHEGVLRGCTTWRAAPFPPKPFHADMQICDCHIYQALTTREDRTCCWGSAYTVFWTTRCFVEGGSSFKAARTSSTFTEGEHVTIWASYPGSCPGNNLLMREPYLNLTRLHAASVSSPYGRQGR